MKTSVKISLLSIVFIVVFIGLYNLTFFTIKKMDYENETVTLEITGIDNKEMFENIEHGKFPNPEIISQDLEVKEAVKYIEGLSKLVHFINIMMIILFSISLSAGVVIFADFLKKKKDEEIAMKENNERKLYR